MTQLASTSSDEFGPADTIILNADGFVCEGVSVLAQCGNVDGDLDTKGYCGLWAG